MYLNIIISSKNRLSLKSFIEVFKTVSSKKKLKMNKDLIFSSKKQNTNVITVLKSPHVNKTAQEQFEFRLFTKGIKINSYQILKILITLKKIRALTFSDIHIQLKFTITVKSRKYTLIKNLKSKKNKFIQNRTAKSLQSYLWVANFYGKHCFSKCLNSSAGRAKD